MCIINIIKIHKCDTHVFIRLHMVKRTRVESTRRSPFLLNLQENFGRIGIGFEISVERVHYIKKRSQNNFKEINIQHT